MSTPLMQCGHSANSISEGKPACAICAGMDRGAYIIAEEQPEFNNRKASCSYCKHENPSSTELAFFHHQPDKNYDRYYCGCRGWG